MELFISDNKCSRLDTTRQLPKQFKSFPKNQLVELVEWDNHVLQHRRSIPTPPPVRDAESEWIVYTKQGNITFAGLKRPLPQHTSYGKEEKQCDENDTSTWTNHFLREKAKEHGVKLPSKGALSLRIALYEQAIKHSQEVGDPDYVP